MKYLRLFQTVAEKEAATLDYPNVNYTIENDSLEIIAEDPTPAFGGLTVKYNIVDATQEVALFNGGGGSSTSSSTSGSGSGSGGGGALPSKMYVDGVEETPINTWRFETAGEHIVQFEFTDNIIPAGFLDGNVPVATEAIIGDDITIIGKTVFKGSTITSATISDSVKSIGDAAFGGCTNLINIIVPDSVTSIGGAAFNGCSSLASVSLGSGVTSIGGAAFSYCSSLTSVIIPDSVTSIDNGAFERCSGLTSVTVEATTPPTLGTNVFKNTNANLVIYVPAESVNAYQTATNWSTYASRIQAIQS